MYDYDHHERRRQITTLLGYPKVGPLSAAAIAVNLGTSEDAIRSAIESLLREGRIVQLVDGRLAHAVGRPVVPTTEGMALVESEAPGREFRDREPG